ncbi:MAG: DMT family transporter [Verrucomicrobia bacterium]|nr:DMT family transporter [Verrucomicrobiota bacterium]
MDLLKMPTRFKPLFLLFLAQLCVGVNIVSKGLTSHIHPFIIMAIRFTVASLFMSLFLIKSGERRRWDFHLTWLDWLVMLAKGVGAGLFFNWLMLTGLSLTNANSAGLITSLLPAIIVCLNVILFKQKLTSQMLIAIMISVAGLILINFESFGAESRHALFGNLLVFAALLPEGLYYTLSKYYPVSKIPPITNSICLTLSNLPLLYVIIAFMPASAWHGITTYDVWSMVLVGIAAGLFFFFWQTGVAKVDPAYAALATAFMPISTVFLAWIILGEGLTVTKLIGMFFVILSIVHYARQQSGTT